MKKMAKNPAGCIVAMLICLLSGGCEVGGIYPALVAVYVITSVLSGFILVPYICVLLGMFAQKLIIGEVDYLEAGIFDSRISEGSTFQKYIMLLTVVMCVIKLLSVQRKKEGTDDYMLLRPIYCLPAPYIVTICVAIALSNLTTYINSLEMAFIYAAIEIGVFICMVNILWPGLLAIFKSDEYEDEKNVLSYDANQMIISTIVIAAVCLWMLPFASYMDISPLIICGLVLLMYTVHAVGASYGFGMAVMVGIIVWGKTGRAGWLLWFLVVALVMLIGRALFGPRKLCTSLFYLLGVGLAAASGGVDMLETERIYSVLINLLSPLPVFLLASKKGGAILKLHMGDVSGACMQAAATEITRLATAKMEDMANTFRRLDYTFAGSDYPVISLVQVGELMDGFKNQMRKMGTAKEITDERLLTELKNIGFKDVRITRTFENDKRNRYFVVGRTAGQGMVLSRQVEDVLSSYMGKRIRACMNSPSLFFDDYRSAVYEEGARYKGRYHVRRIKKYGSMVSGDNFSVKEYEDGRLVMMLSDGMGSGSMASCESCMMIDTMEELLEAGFDAAYSIEFANSCMSKKNRGQSFTTFDMISIDLYTGSLQSFKQGAAGTYILHPKDKGNDIEVITSTTLPVGVLENADCEINEKNLMSGDAVVMISDGISDFGDESELKSVLSELRIGDSRKMADEIIGRMLGQEGSVVRDDATVMVVVLRAV